MSHEPIKLETLGDLKRAGFRFWIACDNPRCNRWLEERLDKLIAELGEDREYVLLRFRCSTCGSPAGVSLSRPA